MASQKKHSVSMGEKMRLDKYLSKALNYSRKDIKKIIRKGDISLNQQIVKDASTHIYENDVITMNGTPVIYREYVYIMLNKPMDYVSATRDVEHSTVIDLIEGYENYDLFPVGRLDIDTEGLLILTNDGQLSHRLLSPKNHIDKKYLVYFEGDLSDDDIEKFKAGVQLEDEYVCKPAVVTQLEQKVDDFSLAYITITEGKYHQVKRMFQALGHHVWHLKRVSMGDLVLDESLKLGEYRELSQAELALLDRR